MTSRTERIIAAQEDVHRLRLADYVIGFLCGRLVAREPITVETLEEAVAAGIHDTEMRATPRTP